MDWSHYPNIRSYCENYGSAFWRIFILTTAQFLILIGLIALEPWPISLFGFSDLSAAQHFERLLFLFYIVFFFSVWLLYYLSPLGDRFSFFNVQSLRRLLRLTSFQWQSELERLSSQDDPDSGEEYEKNFHEKAHSTITAVAVLMAASILLLDQVNQIFLSIKVGTIQNDGWGELILSLSLFFSIASFIAFILSVDDLDSLFNKSKQQNENYLLDYYFYKRAINPKYYGFTFLMLGVVLLVGFYNLIYASTILGIIIFFIYPHLYPAFGKDGSPRGMYLLPRILLVGIPIFYALVHPLL